MDRLTCKYEDASVLREQCTFDRLSTDEPDDWVPCCEICEMKYDGTEVCEACPIQIAIDRLAEYENTGLLPDQIKNINNPLSNEIPIELKEFLHNLRDRDWDINPIYKIDENEGKKLIKALEEMCDIAQNK